MTLESGIFKALYLGSTDLKKNEISKVNGHISLAFRTGCSQSVVMLTYT